MGAVMHFVNFVLEGFRKHGLDIAVTGLYNVLNVVDDQRVKILGCADIAAVKVFCYFLHFIKFKFK